MAKQLYSCAEFKLFMQRHNWHLESFANSLEVRPVLSQGSATVRSYEYEVVMVGGSPQKLNKS